MKAKTLLLSSVSLLLFSTTFAQDKIFKRNGDEIDAKVKEVGGKNITYVRFDNQDGPTYTIGKGEVERIDYQNGAKDEFDEEDDAPRTRMPHHPPSPFDHVTKSKVHYKDDILAIAPFQATENGIGVGLTYERTLDKDGIISFYLPLVVTFNVQDPQNTGNGQNTPAGAMYYAMPGIKIYPTGSHGKVKYAIGPSLDIAGGQKTTNDYYYNGNGYVYNNPQQQHFVLGMLVQNSLNINPTPKLYLGLELGMGASYINRLDGVEQGTEFLIQTAFKVGFRF